MSKLTDFEKHVREQLARIGHLPGFPEGREAIRDYIAAISTAGAPEAVTRLMDEIVSTEWDRVASAATIRRMAYEILEGQQQKQRECIQCGGSGFVTVWRLVTYHVRSSQMKHSEPVPERDWRALAEKSAAEPIGNDRQQVLSAAKVCGCCAA